MKFHKILPCVFLSIFLLALITGAAATNQFEGPVYLNFMDDPRNNMVVIYHLNTNTPPLDVYYRKKGESDWLRQPPVERDFQNEPLNIYHANVTGLSADTKYEFKVGELADIHHFKTMPDDLRRPITGAFGADFQSGSGRWVTMAKLVASHDVDFFVVAGDWVNDDGNINNSSRWVQFWDIMWHELVTPNGRMIPIVAGAGNHECTKKRSVRMKRFFFTDMFAFPNEGENDFYGVIDIGDYISLVALDSMMETIEDQNKWLKGVLSDRAHFTYIVPYYHIPIFPSHRGNFKTRLAWFYSFYDSGIRAAFSGHDHSFKWTHEIVKDMKHENTVRIKKNDERGFIEFGDGGLGTKYYTGNLHDEWYMNKTGTRFGHVNIVTFDKDKMKVEARNHDNEIIDVMEIERR